MFLWDNNDELKKALVYILKKPKGILGTIGDTLIYLGVIFNAEE